jgi:hypothetical protein
MLAIVKWSIKWDVSMCKSQNLILCVKNLSGKIKKGLILNKWNFLLIKMKTGKYWNSIWIFIYLLHLLQASGIFHLRYSYMSIIKKISHFIIKPTFLLRSCIENSPGYLKDIFPSNLFCWFLNYFFLSIDLCLIMCKKDEWMFCEFKFACIHLFQYEFRNASTVTKYSLSTVTINIFEPL